MNPPAHPESSNLLGYSTASTGRALVTGGTGFLGRRLVERLLAQGRSVAVLARTPAPDLEKRGVRFIRAALDDADAMRAACRDIATVFHVAAKVGVWGRYDDFFRANVLGTRALLAGCREHGVARFVHTSTPSVVYNGQPLANADESLPLTTACPSPYPLTKAIAEREVLAAHSPELRTVALRPHLIWGVGDPHLVPRILARARAGRLRIVGDGHNHVDMVHVENAVDAHLAAELALLPRAPSPPAPPSPPHSAIHLPAASVLDASPSLAGPATPNPVCNLISNKLAGVPSGEQSGGAADAWAAGRDDGRAGGRAYFITNGEPVVLWDWINELLTALGEPPVTRHVSLGVASAAGALCEAAWRVLPLQGEPPMTRFIAAELAKDHWFSIDAARRDLGYTPRITMVAGTAELVAALRGGAAK